MKVLKFGGTSVGSVESIKNVKKIVEAVNEPVIVVVSALGGITDKLINTSKLASKGDIAYKKEFEEIVKRHYSIIEYVVARSKRTAVLKRIRDIFDELENIFVGVSLIKVLS
ncbi:MAG: bifunctional aspartate kinase/homoserine dehydrogenase I, partial [Tannerella sp.]|nr:bifunctional aspartate kinase/homoserine dehydrogenase I [Tannerella sp.]